MNKLRIVFIISVVVGVLELASCFDSRGCWQENYKTDNCLGYCEDHLFQTFICNNIEDINTSTHLCKELCSVTFNNYVPIIRTNSFMQLQELKHIFLSESGVETIRAGAFAGLRNIEAIRLDNNKISKFPEGSFSSLPSLKMLDLSNNIIDQIDKEAFMGSGAIKFLDISHNKLKTISPETLEPLQNLKALNLSHNLLEKMEKNWCYDFHSLLYLELNNNDIAVWDDCSSNNLIETISLSNNFLKNLSYPAFPNSLTVLNLNNNNISLLHKSAFQNLKNLTHLNIANNKIKVIPFGLFINLKKLYSLNISSNAIQFLENGILFGLNELRLLNLSHNRLIQLDTRIFFGTDTLIDLDISYNYLESLNTEFLLSICPNLGFLIVDGNNFTCSELGNIMYQTIKSRQSHLVSSGFSFETPNIKGIKCLNDFNEVSKLNTELSHFTDQNITKSLLNYMQNFSNLNRKKVLEGDKKLESSLNEIVSSQKDLSRNITNQLHDLINSEKQFFQNFLTTFSNSLDVKNKNIPKVEQLKKNNSETNSFHEYFEQMLNVVKESKLQTDNLEKMYRNQLWNSNQLQTSEALQSQDNRLENMITIMNQMKLLFIACTLIFLSFCVIKCATQFKSHSKENKYNMQENQELPVFQHV